MAQDETTPGADACSCSHSDSASRERTARADEAERRRAVAYLDLWERQIALTAARYRFSPTRRARPDRRPN
jgi:hypothetical protein